MGYYMDEVGDFVNGAEVIGDLLWLLPELGEYVKCPNSLTPGAPRLVEGWAYCPEHRDSVAAMVQHLNDGCHWTREQVADWLDTLDLDLTFPTEPPAPNPWRTRTWPSPSLGSVSDWSVDLNAPVDDVHAWKLVMIGAPKEGKSYFSAVADELHKLAAGLYIHDLKTVASIDMETWCPGSSWLDKYFKEEDTDDTSVTLHADAALPDLLKRPDGTTLPDIAVDVWLGWDDGEPKLLKNVKLHPDVAEQFAFVPKPLQQPTPPPGADDITRPKKGKHRGKHRRT